MDLLRHGDGSWPRRRWVPERSNSCSLRRQTFETHLLAGRGQFAAGRKSQRQCNLPSAMPLNFLPLMGLRAGRKAEKKTGKAGKRETPGATAKAKANKSQDAYWEECEERWGHTGGRTGASIGRVHTLARPNAVVFCYRKAFTANGALHAKQNGNFPKSALNWPKFTYFICVNRYDHRRNFQLAIWPQVLTYQ